MKFVEEYRASKILYNFLVSNKISGTFILPSNVCEVVPLTFYLAGVDVTFVDICSITLCMDFDEARKKIASCSGLLYVHTYGLETCPLSEFKEIKKVNKEFIIIDDCCLCLPNVEEKLDNLIDLRLFSLRRTKQVNLDGAVGLVSDRKCYYPHETTFDEKADEAFHDDIRFCLTSQFQISNKRYCFLDNQRFVFDHSLFREKYNASQIKKERLNSIYRKNLPESIQLADAFQYWRFNILVENKQNILDSLFQEGLFASSHFAPKAFIWNREEDGANAIYLSQHVINLFNDEFYSDEQAFRTCRIINDCLR